jgi:GT2 family glycosyltransferase
MKMKVAVVIPNWNGADIIANSIKSLQAQAQQHQLIVVDNGSVDSSVELIEQKFPDVTILKNPKNLGFAGGVNTGIRHAIDQGFDAVALFNNDAVAEKNWLKQLVRCLEGNPLIGIATCKFMRDDRIHFDSTGDFYSIRGIPFPRGRNQLDHGQYDKQESVFGASGGASIYRSTMLKEVGLFDERFFAYYEDVDISFRARLYGYDIVYNPNSVAYHAVSATSSKLGSFSHYHSNKNFYFLYLKNMPIKLLLKYFPSFAYQMARSALSSVVHHRTISYIKAIAYVVYALPSVLIDRHRIQKHKKITADEIDRLLYHSRPPISPDIKK